MKRFISLVLVFVLAVSIFAGCAGNASTSDSSAAAPSAAGSTSSTAASTASPSGGGEVIKIGALFPLSGSSSSDGTYSMHGVQYALEDFMEHYGDKLNGNTIEFIVADTATSPDTGVAQFEKLVNEEKVSAVIGTYNGGVAASVAPLAIKYQVPFAVATAVSDLVLAEDSNYIFRTNMGDADAEVYLIEFYSYLKSLGNMDKVAAVFMNNDLAQNGIKLLREKVFPVVGMELVLDEIVNIDSSDLSATVNKVKNSGADFVVSCLALNDAVLFARQFAEYEVDMPFVGYGSGYSSDLYLIQGAPYCEYTIFSSSWTYDKSIVSEDAHVIAEKYVAETGTLFPVESFGNAWLATYNLLDAVARAGSGDREAIANALDTTDIKREDGHRALLFNPLIEGVKFEDFLGRYNQNKYASVQFSQIINGEHVTVYPLNPETGKSPIVVPPPKWSER